MKPAISARRRSRSGSDLFQRGVSSYFLHLGDQTWTQDALGPFRTFEKHLGAGAGARSSIRRCGGAVGDELKTPYRPCSAAWTGNVRAICLSTGRRMIICRSCRGRRLWDERGRNFPAEQDYTVNYAVVSMDFQRADRSRTDNEIRRGIRRVQLRRHSDDESRGLEITARRTCGSMSPGFVWESDVDSSSAEHGATRIIKCKGAIRQGTFGPLRYAGCPDRPWRMDRIGARLRWETGTAFCGREMNYYGKMDTNTVSGIREAGFRGGRPLKTLVRQHHAAVAWAES